jgi:hypothetical protein
VAGTAKHLPARAGAPLSARMGGPLYARAGALLAILAGAVVLRVASGVGFANYDTLYALVWGQQAARGETPQYGIPVAPTPHPLVEALGALLAPLGPRAAEHVTVALGFLALAACGWGVYRLGALWFNRAVGAVAAAVLLTRMPTLSYGVRAYVDLPYLALVLGAVVVETRRPRAGAPVLALLAAAGLLRPEAWVFSGGYWLYLFWPYIACVRARARCAPQKDNTPHGAPAGRGLAGGESTVRGLAVGKSAVGESAVESSATAAPGGPPGEQTPRTLRELVWLAGLAAAAPLVWVASDWAVTGNAAWSLTNTRHTAETLHRETGAAKVPEYIPRRIGEILGPAALAAAAVGGVLSLAWLRARAVPGATVGVVAVGVFAAFAAAGLPIDTRYAFLAAAVGCVFCGAAVCGWAELPRGDPRRRWWMAAAAAVLVVFVVTGPAQYNADHNQLDALARQQQAQDDLIALVHEGAVTARCEPIGVPNHAPIPLLALWLESPPAAIVSAQVQAIVHGTYVAPATAEVRRDYILDRNDPHPRPAAVPPGFTPTHANRSWRVYQRCNGGAVGRGGASARLGGAPARWALGLRAQRPSE